MGKNKLLALVPSSYVHSRMVTAWPTSSPLGASTLKSVVRPIWKRVPLNDLRRGQTKGANQIGACIHVQEHGASRPIWKRVPLNDLRGEEAGKQARHWVRECGHPRRCGHPGRDAPEGPAGWWYYC